MITLRPYQKEVDDGIVDAWDRGASNVLANMPTGGGKTAVMAHRAKAERGPVCAIAHRQELVGQISMAFAREGIKHKIVGPRSVVKACVEDHIRELGTTFYDFNAPTAVAGVDTLIRRVDQLSPWAQNVSLWMQDECFPPGTLVGGAPIETLRVGDKVTSYDELTGTFHQRPIVRLFKSPTPKYMVRVFGFPCTPGHPFLTRRGWVAAAYLKADDEVAQMPSCGGIYVSNWSRVGRVEVLVSAPGQSYVYNIEVEEFHTYTVYGLVVHNCHHVLKDNKWGAAADMFPNARGLGVTATPVRADGKGLGAHADGVFHAMVEGAGMRTLIDAGYLADYRIFAPTSDIDLSAVPVSKTTGDFRPKTLSVAIEQSGLVGDIVVNYLEFARGKLGVTFVDNVARATAVAEAYNAAGIPAQVVSAKTTSADRRAYLSALRNRDLLQLVNVDLFGEGFDLPAIEVVTMARPTHSYALFVQQFGRVLRLLLAGALPSTRDARLAAIANSTKPKALIIDHVGNVARHGLPDAPRVWTLDRRARRSSGVSEGVIPVKICAQCTAVYERVYKTCPECGYLPEPLERSAPEHVDGDLTELDDATLKIMRDAVDTTDMSKEAFRALLVSKYVPLVGQYAGVNRHMATQKAQSTLRHAIALWAGHRRAEGVPDSESYRRFYFKFGVDVLTAQTLKAKDADVLCARLNEDMS